MSELRRFKQVDVFSAVPLNGNPLAVVMDADGLSDDQMLAIARWTNLSETTFVLPPSEPQADYQVKIYSPAGELPFAGHPTLGTAHALLENGFKPKLPGHLVQQCGVGNVTIAIARDGMLAFEAPKATMTPLPAQRYGLLTAAAGGEPSAGKGAPTVVDMGIRWLMVEVSSAGVCLALQPQITALAELLAQCGATGVAFYGRHAPAGDVDFEMRAFIIEHGCLVEDPVTGSANACLARLLPQRDFAGNPAFSESYRVRQGTCRQRDGRVFVDYLRAEPWIGGYSTTLIEGNITL
ncbi:phenazine biosynthesis protein PhzF family [Sodalis sp. TME1]|nr:phenazine biosynthesis protein PhzF family [Sodalis sp. TME1]